MDVTRCRRVPAVVAVLIAGGLLVTGCVPEPDAAAPASPSPTATASPTVTPGATPTATATPSPAPTVPFGAVPLPRDCRGLLSPGVAAQLEGIPLNDPVFAPVGVQPDGSLICVWRDPGSDTTGIRTEIGYLARGAALDLLNGLVDAEGFTCYEPDGGVRCEKTWQNAQYPVTDGRTLFWRDDVLIDTVYSNLAPEGYTAGIVAAVFG